MSFRFKVKAVNSLPNEFGAVELETERVDFAGSLRLGGSSVTELVGNSNIAVGAEFELMLVKPNSLESRVAKLESDVSDMVNIGASQMSADLISLKSQVGVILEMLKAR